MTEQDLTDNDPLYSVGAKRYIEEHTIESINIILSDYRAAIKSITEAFNERLAKHDRLMTPEIKLNLQTKPKETLNEPVHKKTKARSLRLTEHIIRCKAQNNTRD